MTTTSKVTATAYESWVDDSGVINISNSRGKVEKSNDVGDLLRFLRYSSSQTIRVMWSLDDTISPLLRLLPPDVLDRLSRFDDALTYQDNELYCLPGRLFRVGKARFYGIRDFWGGLTNQVPTLKETQAFADDLLGSLARSGLADPRKLTSPIAVFEDSEPGRKLYSELPRGYDIPEDCYEMLEFASEADHKDWVSNHYVGFFDAGEIFDYDMTACYPSIVSSLPDLRDLSVWKSKTLGKKEWAAAIGIVKGRFTLDPEAEYAHCSPIMAPVGELPGNPHGHLPEDCYTMDEVCLVVDNGLGTFKIKEGWFAHSDNSEPPRQPFKRIMEALYRKRSLSPLTGSVMKSIANSLIGKLIETKVSGEYGPLRNDIYHAMVTAGARVEVAKFLIDNKVKPDELVCVQTDGVRLTREIEVSGDDMGSWRCNGSSPTIVISPYKVYSSDARPYQLTYDDIVELINEHPLAQRYARMIQHRLTLVQAIRQHEDATKVGEMMDVSNSLDLIALDIEQNRRYSKLPKNGRALLKNKYPSTPFIL